MGVASIMAPWCQMLGRCSSSPAEAGAIAAQCPDGPEEVAMSYEHLHIDGHGPVPTEAKVQPAPKELYEATRPSTQNPASQARMPKEDLPAR